MNCEDHSDFVTICCFISCFGHKIPQCPKYFKLKKWLENGARQNRDELAFQSFVRTLLKGVIRGQVRHSMGPTTEDIDDTLIYFLKKEKRHEQASSVRSFSFFCLPLAEKLRIICMLLEAHLKRNNTFGMWHIDKASGEELRPTLLGQDINGNSYWKLKEEGKRFSVIKEKVSENEESLLMFIQNGEQIRDLIKQIKRIKELPRPRDTSLKCQRCQKKYVKGNAPRNFTATADVENQCPKCDQLELLKNLEEYLTEE